MSKRKEERNKKLVELVDKNILTLRGAARAMKIKSSTAHEIYWNEKKREKKLSMPVP